METSDPPKHLESVLNSLMKPAPVPNSSTSTKLPSSNRKPSWNFGVIVIVSGLIGYLVYWCIQEMDRIKAFWAQSCQRLQNSKAPAPVSKPLKTAPTKAETPVEEPDDDDEVEEISNYMDELTEEEQTDPNFQPLSN